MLFDSHNHLQSGKFGRPVGELVAEMKNAGITGRVVNATREADWEAVAALASEFPGYVFPAYGIHPWYADTAAEGWEVAERLQKKGAWFSFSGHFLHPRKAKVMEVFRKLPEGRILLETLALGIIPPD